MKRQKIIVTAMLVTLALNSSFVYSAQTLDELEKEISQIEENTEKAAAAQEDVKAEQLSSETELLDVKAEMDSIQEEINKQQSKIDSKNSEIEQQKKEIDEIQKKIPKAKKQADRSLKTLQRADNSNILIQLVVTPSEDDGDNILRRIDSLNRLSEYAGKNVVDLIELEKELQLEEKELDKQLAELELEQQQLSSKENELELKKQSLNDLIASQAAQISELDTAANKSAEDAQMKQDALEYYESLGCSGTDTVGSKCGVLADDDGDGIANADDSCPNEYGTDGYGCEVEVTDEDNNSENGNSGGSGSNGGSVDNGNSGGNSNSGGSGNSNSGNGNSNGGNSNSGGGGSTGTSASFARPLSHGVVTCDYGCYDGHVGVDMDYSDNVPILATSDGVVTTAKGGCAAYANGTNTCNGGYGNYVMVTHYTNEGIFFSLYAHLSSISVSQGQTVSQGQQVGLLGDSGNSAGSHLHFELYKDTNSNGIPDDYKTDPRNYLSLPQAWSWW